MPNLKLKTILTVLLLVCLSLPTAFGEDLVELMNGSTLTGKMLEIRKDAREFDFSSKFGQTAVTRTYSYASVHAVTFNGKRFVLTPKQATSEGETSTGGITRTPAELRKYIEQVGSTPPDWLASTDMNHPSSLDLDWPLKAPGKWDESKNIGQYIWGRVNPNVSRWKPGIKLVHHVMERHQRNPTLLKRDMEKLGEMYFTLLQDYPRAAYWLQKAKVSATTPTGIHLAECYWRLGSKPMAMEMLKGRSLHLNAIKLLGDMDEVDKAMALTASYANTNAFNEAFLNAGDALRGAGRLDEAIEYYQRVLDINKARNAEYLKRYQARAAESIEAIKLFDKADVSRVADGTYTAHSTGYNGQMNVEVTVADQKIRDVRVTKHSEKQFYSALTDTTTQIIDQQGIQDVDGTSGATITSQAIVSATARALAKGAN
ncbi:FMN-binding protein [Novipirellula caenicola]|uniref:FMN-binding domain-containing protein n=1 Tax=Novipirellula caenicola TaxID=1536901 RepID=A0ABP9VRV4_9BACT